jgi:uncharacterized protein YndB with AHSA1/START domain
MKLILIVAAVLVSGVAVVALMGALLPKEHVVTRTVELPRPPEEIFARISDFEDQASWRPDVKRVELKPPSNGARLQFAEQGSHGTILFEVLEMQAPSRLVTRIADPTLPFGGQWTYALTPSGHGTQLSITEAGEVYNPLFRFLSRFVFGHTATIDAYLENLKRAVAK